MRKVVIGLSAFLICSILGLSMVGLLASTAPTPPTGMLGKYVEVNNTKIRVLQKGQGQDLLLIHGLPGSIEDWEAVTGTLAQRYRVTVYDRPGHGFSEYSQALASIPGNTDVALALIDKLNLQNPIVVGHSYGGAISASMASRNPDNIKGFVSVAGIIHLDAIDPIYHLIAIPALGAGVAKVANQFIGKEMMNEAVPKAFYPNGDVMPEGFIEQRATMWLTVKNSLAVAYEEINIVEDLKAIALDKITHPFVILQGDKDLSVPVSNGEKFNTEIKNSSLTVLDNMGHFIQYADPAVVIKAIDDLASAATTAAQP
jgi:pimeloyl-ACP methyl ester carboxylesterase